MKILVVSCDNHEDLGLPFHICIEKYWPDHPEIIYSTETKVNPYYKTICLNYDINNGSTRVKTCLESITDNLVLIMVDDIFCRDYVDNDKINNIINNFPEDAAAINLEKSFDRLDSYYSELLLKRSANGNYKTSVMCGIGNREKAIKVFDVKLSPGDFERKNNHLNYNYYILHDYAFDWGYKFGKWAGICRGKWCREIVPFFEKENIKIDYSIRGFYD